MYDGSIPDIPPIGRLHGDLGVVKQSMSGEWGRARLKRDGCGVQVDKLGIRDETQEFDGLRQQQHGGRCEQRRIRQGDNRADRAGVARLVVWIVTGRRLRLCEFARRIRRDKTGVIERGLCRADLTRGRSLRGDGMEMTERERELHGERKQREPRAMFDVRPEPLHADKCLPPESRDIPAA